MRFVEKQTARAFGMVAKLFQFLGAYGPCHSGSRPAWACCRLSPGLSLPTIVIQCDSRSSKSCQRGVMMFFAEAGTKMLGIFSCHHAVKSGLDHSHDGEGLRIQQHRFANHIRVGAEVGLPVVKAQRNHLVVAGAHRRPGAGAVRMPVSSPRTSK